MIRSMIDDADGEICRAGHMPKPIGGDNEYNEKTLIGSPTPRHLGTMLMIMLM